TIAFGSGSPQRPPDLFFMPDVGLDLASRYSRRVGADVPVIGIRTSECWTAQHHVELWSQEHADCALARGCGGIARPRLVVARLCSGFHWVVLFIFPNACVRGGFCEYSGGSISRPSPSSRRDWSNRFRRWIVFPASMSRPLPMMTSTTPGIVPGRQ